MGGLQQTIGNPDDRLVHDAFVATINAPGASLLDLNYLGGSDFESAKGVALDAAGNIYVAGVTYSTNFPTANAAQPIYGGDRMRMRALVLSAFVGLSAADFPSVFLELIQLVL